MHRCPYPQCPEKVPGSKFACKTHWFMLPEDIRSEIWSAYRKKDYGGHMAAMSKAVKWYRGHETGKVAGMVTERF